MNKHIKQLLAQPIFEDEAKNITAYLLHKILLGFFIMIGSLSIGIIFLTDSGDFRRSVVFSSLIMLVILYGLFKQGYIYQASILLVLMFWFNFTIGAWNVGGIRAPVIAIYVLTTLIAGSLLGKQAGMAFTVLSIITNICLFYAEMVGLITFQASNIPPALALMFHIFLLCAIVMFVYLYAQQLNDLLKQSRDNEQLLAENAEQLAQQIAERQQAEAHNQQLQAEQLALQAALIESQQQTIQQLATPIIPIINQVIIMPLVGNLDSLRANHLMRAIMDGISQHRAKIVIIDITGVSVVDTTVAERLNKTIQVARLKGTYPIITGISPVVAETIVELGIDWSHIETVRDLQTGLRVALNSLGVTLTK